MKENFRKYFQVFKISIQEVFVWRINFLLWRFRVVLQLLVLYFLWLTVFSSSQNILGYTREMMFTYILGASLIRSFTLSSRTADIAGEINQGILTNFLLKPLSYFKYWFTRDLSDKALNIFFSVFEIILFYLLFKPPLFIQSNGISILGSFAVTILSILVYFYFSFLISILSFWVIEVWGLRFLTMILIDFMSGGIFPLDILPRPIFSILQATPFPYLTFFPLKVYLGDISLAGIATGILIMLVWLIILRFLVVYVWRKGLQVYSAEGI